MGGTRNIQPPYDQLKWGFYHLFNFLEVLYVKFCDKHLKVNFKNFSAYSYMRQNNTKHLLGNRYSAKLFLSTN